MTFLRTRPIDPNITDKCFPLFEEVRAHHGGGHLAGHQLVTEGQAAVLLLLGEEVVVGHAGVQLRQHRHLPEVSGQEDEAGRT